MCLYWDEMTFNALTSFIDQLEVHPDTVGYWTSDIRDFEVCKSYMSVVHYHRLMQLVTAFFSQADAMHPHEKTAVSLPQKVSPVSSTTLKKDVDEVAQDWDILSREEVDTAVFEQEWEVIKPSSR